MVTRASPIGMHTNVILRDGFESQPDSRTSLVPHERNNPVAAEKSPIRNAGSCDIWSPEQPVSRSKMGWYRSPPKHCWTVLRNPPHRRHPSKRKASRRKLCNVLHILGILYKRAPTLGAGALARPMAFHAASETAIVLPTAAATFRPASTPASASAGASFETRPSIAALLLLMRIGTVRCPMTALPASVASTTAAS